MLVTTLRQRSLTLGYFPFGSRPFFSISSRWVFDRSMSNCLTDFRSIAAATFILCIKSRGMSRKTHEPAFSSGDLLFDMGGP